MKKQHKKTKPRKKVMVFGTFDFVHKGHINFLKQAKSKGDLLVVSVARDVNVRRIKGKKPMFSETQRKKQVALLGIADKVVLGDKKDYLGHIKKICPDIIALGYDQKAYTENLRADLNKAGLPAKIVRLKSFKPHLYKSSKLKNPKLKKKASAK